MMLRKLLIFRRIDAVGWVISETPVENNRELIALRKQGAE
jgi:hypothetical protein